MFGPKSREIAASRFGGRVMNEGHYMERAMGHSHWGHTHYQVCGDDE